MRQATMFKRKTCARLALETTLTFGVIICFCLYAGRTVKMSRENCLWCKKKCMGLLYCIVLKNINEALNESSQT